MRRSIIVLLGLAALFVSVNLAAARDGCGRGFFWNGYHCVPMGDEPRYYRDEYAPYPGPRQWNTWNGCPPHYTIQDGVCKPYRGY